MRLERLPRIFQHSNWGEGPNLLFKDKDIDIITKNTQNRSCRRPWRNRNITKQISWMSNWFLETQVLYPDISKNIL